MGLIQLPTFKMRPDKQIVPLTYEHLLALQLGPHEQEYAKNIPGYLDYLWENSEFGWSWSAIGKGRIICCFGVRHIWANVVECWFLPGEGLNEHARSTLVGARAILQDVMDSYDITRMQITVKCDHPIAVRFAKSLYFDVECRLRKYGPEGADYYSMARFD